MGREKLPAQNSGSAGLIAFACGLLMQYCTNVIERHFVASSCLGLHATLDTLVVSGKFTVSSAFLTQGIGNRQRVGICQPIRKPFIEINAYYINKVVLTLLKIIIIIYICMHQFVLAFV